MFDTWFPQNWSTLKKLIWLRMTALGNVIKTVTGTIVTFTCKSAKPILNLTANLSPIQDLHGYDNPWPAGGGVNKFDGEFQQGSALDLATPNRVVCVNTIPVKSGETYTFSASDYINFDYILNSSQNSTLPFSGDYSYCGTSTTWVHTDITFTATNDGYVAIVVRGAGSPPIVPSDVSGIKMQFEKSATSSAWTPYANLCPISGHTGVTVTRTGRNLYSRDNGQYNVPFYATDGTATAYADVNVVWVKVKPNTKYTITNQPNDKTYYVRWIECDENKCYVWRDPSTMTNAVPSRTYTTSANTHYLQIAANQWDTASISSNDWEVCIQEGTDSTYYPYTGTTYPITFPDAAGTVYGGTLAVHEDGTGTLTVSHKFKSLTDAWSQAGNGAFYLDDKAADGTGGTTNEKASVWCNMYSQGYCGGAASVAIEHPKTLCTQTLRGVRFIVYDTSFTLADFNAYVASNPIQINYELATPLVYTLTAEQVGAVITTLKGQNTIWVDDSDDISVTYYE